jgi:hypothetical protein
MRPTLLLPCLLLTVSTTALAASTPASAPVPAEDHATNAAPDYSAPGPEHARLAGLAGKWTSTYRVTPAPGAKPMDVPGTASFRATLNGLWIDGDTELRLGEQRILGRVTYGFDRFKQRYVLMFVQDSDSQPLFGFGVPDSAGTRITFTLPMDIPLVGRQGVPMRTVLDFSSPGRMVFEMNAPMPDGTEYQPVRIEYTRVR